MGFKDSVYTKSTLELINNKDLEGTLVANPKPTKYFLENYNKEYGISNETFTFGPFAYGFILKIYDVFTKCTKENKDCILNSVLNYKIDNTEIGSYKKDGRMIILGITYYVVHNGKLEQIEIN
jgi:hypothetical protein